MINYTKFSVEDSIWSEFGWAVFSIGCGLTWFISLMQYPQLAMFALIAAMIGIKDEINSSVLRIGRLLISSIPLLIPLAAVYLIIDCMR